MGSTAAGLDGSQVMVCEKRIATGLRLWRGRWQEALDHSGRHAASQDDMLDRREMETCPDEDVRNGCCSRPSDRACGDWYSRSPARRRGGGKSKAAPTPPLPPSPEYTTGIVGSYVPATRTLKFNTGGEYKISPSAGDVSIHPGDKVQLRWLMKGDRRVADDAKVTMAAPPEPEKAPETTPDKASADAPGSAPAPADAPASSS